MPNHHSLCTNPKHHTYNTVHPAKFILEVMNENSRHSVPACRRQAKRPKVPTLSEGISLRRKTHQEPIRPPGPNPPPPPSRCTQAQTPPAPTLQSPSPSYSSPTSPPTASTVGHSRLHSSHSSTKPSSPVSPSASSLARSESSENVCKTISVFQSLHQSPWRLRHATYLAVHAIPSWKIQKNPVFASPLPQPLRYLA